MLPEMRRKLRPFARNARHENEASAKVWRAGRASAERKCSRRPVVAGTDSPPHHRPGGRRAKHRAKGREGGKPSEPGWRARPGSEMMKREAKMGEASRSKARRAPRQYSIDAAGGLNPAGERLDGGIVDHGQPRRDVALHERRQAHVDLRDGARPAPSRAAERLRSGEVELAERKDVSRDLRGCVRLRGCCPDLWAASFGRERCYGVVWLRVANPVAARAPPSLSSVSRASSGHDEHLLRFAFTQNVLLDPPRRESRFWGSCATGKGRSARGCIVP